MKGGGKGGLFQGNCSWCHKWGHKRADCRARIAHEKGGGGSNKGDTLAKGNEKGKDGGQTGRWQSKGGYKGSGWQSGGWQIKGGKSRGKGDWGKNSGKGGFQGSFFNIDGRDFGNDYGYSDYGNWSSGGGGYNSGLWLFESDDDGSSAHDSSSEASGDVGDLLMLSEDAVDLSYPEGDARSKYALDDWITASNRTIDSLSVTSTPQPAPTPLTNSYYTMPFTCTSRSMRRERHQTNETYCSSLICCISKVYHN